MRNSPSGIKRKEPLPVQLSPSRERRRPPTPNTNSKPHQHRMSTPPPSPRQMTIQNSKSDDEESLGSYGDDEVPTNPQFLSDEFDIFKSKGTEDGLFGLAFVVGNNWEK
eukprot:CAMPEP_0195294972 /NCGR_PEP_ID=MMETSP0707-20130614/16310_1 /TAXON_ID=33640 /ORGANISM="Asterionellopsis glacialis, Strain CCMP134" /LENGTH=108 /DNA_ID=CAMNT_0040356075 /DNA_START=86 /DNA_END=412 /DNA_ORIENTATION=-